MSDIFQFAEENFGASYRPHFNGKNMGLFVIFNEEIRGEVPDFDGEIIVKFMAIFVVEPTGFKEKLLFPNRFFFSVKLNSVI